MVVLILAQNSVARCDQFRFAFSFSVRFAYPQSSGFENVVDWETIPLHDHVNRSGRFKKMDGAGNWNYLQLGSKYYTSLK